MTKIEKQSKVVKMRAISQRFSRIAAVMLVLITAWVVTKNTLNFTPQTIEERWAVHEIKDPKKAFEATKAALVFASIKLNRGTKKAAVGVEKFKKYQNILKPKIDP